MESGERLGWILPGSDGSVMPGVLTKQALDYLWGPDDRRLHIVRRDTMRPLENGLYEGVTLCGQRVVGKPLRDASLRPTCEHCLAARRA